MLDNGLLEITYNADDETFYRVDVMIRPPQIIYPVIQDIEGKAVTTSFTLLSQYPLYPDRKIALYIKDDRKQEILQDGIIES